MAICADHGNCWRTDRWHDNDVGGGQTKLITSLLLLLLVCPVAAADLDSPTIGAKMVQRGLEYFYTGIADNLYSIGYQPPGTNRTNGTTSEIFIYELNTHTYDPYKYDAVNDFRGKCFILLVIAAVIYALIGGTYAMACVVGAATVVDGVLNRSSTYRAMRIKEYFENMLVAICVIAFTDLYIMGVLAVNFLVVSFLITGLLTTTSVATFYDNEMLYLAMAVSYVTEFGFMIARAMLILMFAASGRLIGVLLISNKTRALGISLVYYLTGVVFLQSVLVGITTLGYIAIEVLIEECMIYQGSPVEGLMYCVLIIILIIASLLIMVGLVRMKHTVITTAKLVI